ncbi:unnamed protein product [Nezara viridula]|uniref:Uncharacterized protein n=1 Tax=Nezara viridula TaxID=85310 RepID=A0A9P0H315_NEZVI|nr:unnamed protein product [Nezara viridula]
MLLAIVREIECRPNESKIQKISRLGRFLISIGATKNPRHFKIYGVNYRSRSHPRWYYTLVRDNHLGSKVIAIETVGPHFYARATYGRMIFQERFNALSIFQFEGHSYELPQFSVRLSHGTFCPRDSAAFVEIKCKCSRTKKPRLCYEMFSLLMDAMGVDLSGVRHHKSQRFARRYESFNRKAMYMSASLRRTEFSWYVM